MMLPVPQLLVDSSTVVKWEMRTEPLALQAEELFQDWRQQVVHVCVPDQLPIEIASALLRATRRHPPRLTHAAATQALSTLLNLPFTVFRTRGKRTLTRALEIADQFNQRIYDCVYVALAERKRIEFWTADERLYNALHTEFPSVKWIAHYQRKRPLP